MLDPLIERLVNSFRSLPGIGQRSARRIVMSLCQHPEHFTDFISTLKQAQQSVGACSICRNFTSLSRCSICSDNNRLSSAVCVVSQPQDVIAIEKSQAFSGRYFVLHGLLSPLDGIGAEELGLPALMEQANHLCELVLALPYTVDGEATASLIIDSMSHYPLSISRIAQGIPSGGDVSNMDHLTLSQALNQRTRFTPL